MVVFVWSIFLIVAIKSMTDGNHKKYNNISISEREGETNGFFK
jgi:hypothetical protein